MTNITLSDRMCIVGGNAHMSVDKKANFVRIAEARTNKIIESIALLGNLSNASYYEYTQDQVKKIFRAIQEELDNQKKKFSAQEPKKKKFRL